MVLSSIALTGASGMLGRHVAPALAAAGFQVIACARHKERATAVSEARVWDLTRWRSFDELDALFEGARAIVHAGAMVPKTAEPLDEGQMFDANVRACLNLGEWALARSVPVVHISGAIVYVETERQGIDETALTGHPGLGGFYGLTKLLAEDIFRRLQERGLRVAILRPSSIYGTGLAVTKMLRVFLATAAKGETIELASPVDDRIDLIHAADVASAVVDVLTTEAWDTFNLASGHPVSVLEIANACLAATGKGKVQIREATQDVGKPSSRFCLNCDRAERVLGWTPAIGLEEGIAALFENSVPTLAKSKELKARHE